MAGVDVEESLVIVEASRPNSPCVEVEGEVAELLVMVAVLGDDGGDEVETALSFSRMRGLGLT